MLVMEITSSRGIAPFERPDPEPSGNQVRVDVKFCGICGSDLHMRSDPAFPVGAVLGHELSGVVSAIGDDVVEWKPGDRVTVLPYENCGECRYCLAGAENHCQLGGHLGSVLGVDRHGGLAESILADSSALIALPESASLQQGALVEPVAVAYRAVERVISLKQDPVVVVGAGPIGILVALLLGVRGFTDVRILDRNVARLGVAASLGLRVLEPGDVRGHLRGLDVATFVDCSGAPSAIRDEVAAVRACGRVVLVGLPSGDLAYDAPDAILREVEVVGSAGYSRRDFVHAVGVLAQGRLPVGRIITRVAPLSEVDQMFDELADPATTHIKILLQI